MHPCLFPDTEAVTQDLPRFFMVVFSDDQIINVEMVLQLFRGSRMLVSYQLEMLSQRRSNDKRTAEGTERNPCHAQFFKVTRAFIKQKNNETRLGRVHLVTLEKGRFLCLRKFQS